VATGRSYGILRLLLSRTEIAEPWFRWETRGVPFQFPIAPSAPSLYPWSSTVLLMRQFVLTVVGAVDAGVREFKLIYRNENYSDGWDRPCWRPHCASMFRPAGPMGMTPGVRVPHVLAGDRGFCDLNPGWNVPTRSVAPRKHRKRHRV